MAVKQTRRQTIYGYPNPQAGLQQVAPELRQFTSARVLLGT